MREHHLREMAPQMVGQLRVTVREDTARQQKSNKAAHTGGPPAEDKLFVFIGELQEPHQLVSAGK